MKDISVTVAKTNIGFIVLIAAVLLSACTKTPDEAAIRDAIGDMSLAVENKESRTFLAYLDPAFQDQYGRDAKVIRQVLAYHFLANQNITVVITDIQIQITGSTAQAILHVATTGASRLIPERGQYYELTTGWRKLDGEWLVVSASWQPLLFQPTAATVQN